MNACTARQVGFSLIELMISMTISLFLILGVTQLYIDGKARALYFNGQAQNLDNARYAQMVLEGRLAKAGYRRLPSTRLGAAFPALSSNGCVFTSGQALVRVDANTLCLRYQPRDNVDVDCTGGSLSGVAGVTKPYGVFSPSNNVVEKITLSGGNLTCNGTVLVENVVAVQFDYGVDASSDEFKRKIAQYSASPGSGQTVRGVRYALLLTSSNSNLTGGMSSTVCQNWKTLTGATSCSDTDGSLRRIVSGTSMLRNLMP